MPTKKTLGQHWLRDRHILELLVDEAGLDKHDTVLEIGPGLGTLTSVLLSRAKQVVAVEFDPELAHNLPAQFPGKALSVISDDILSFNLSSLPRDYKVVANLPYYITSKIIHTLLTSPTPPSMSVLLVQNEVADRLAASPGGLSVLGISAQLFCEVRLGQVIPAEFFIPPPKVDSRVVILTRRRQPLVPSNHQKQFFRIVKAGFSQKRKKLHSSLSGGLGLDKQLVKEQLLKADISPDQRAQDLCIADWQNLAGIIKA